MGIQGCTFIMVMALVCIHLNLVQCDYFSRERQQSAWKPVQCLMENWKQLAWLGKIIRKQTGRTCQFMLIFPSGLCVYWLTYNWVWLSIWSVPGQFPWSRQTPSNVDNQRVSEKFPQSLQADGVWWCSSERPTPSHKTIYQGSGFRAGRD